MQNGTILKEGQDTLLPTVQRNGMEARSSSRLGNTNAQGYLREGRNTRMRAKF